MKFQITILSAETPLIGSTDMDKADLQRVFQFTLAILLIASSPSRLVGQVIDPSPDRGAWSEVLNGLKYRLHSETEVWPSWQRPTVTLEIQNAAGRTLQAAELRNRIFSTATGTFVMQKPIATDTDLHALKWKTDVELDDDAIKSLEAGESIAIPMTLIGTWQTRALALHDSVQPDRFQIAVGIVVPGSNPKPVSNLLTVVKLPPGIRTERELLEMLTQYEINGQEILAGFVPGSSEFVFGQQLPISFLVINRSARPFWFEFGGDYRGSGRHDRFKIQGKDLQGNELNDPLGRPIFRGGMVASVKLPAGRWMYKEIDLEEFRVVPGPGEYQVTATFELAKPWGSPEKTTWDPQVVESNIGFDVLPRTDANVNRVLGMLLDQSRQTSGLALQKLVKRISNFGRSAAVPGLAKFAREAAPEVRREAIRGLGNIAAPESLDVLLEIERDATIRSDALRSLGSFAQPRAVDRLIAALGDRGRSIREAAIDGLGRTKTDAATTALTDLFESSSSATEQESILAALGEGADPKSLQTVVNALGIDSLQVRRAAVDAIVQSNVRKLGNQLLVVSKYEPE